jgi:hypothetical protein
MMYASGVFDVDTCCVEQNHALTLVGYGHDETTGLDYWLAQNRYVHLPLVRSDATDIDSVSWKLRGRLLELPGKRAPPAYSLLTFSAIILCVVGALVGERPAM